MNNDNQATTLKEDILSQLDSIEASAATPKEVLPTFVQPEVPSPVFDQTPTLFDEVLPTISTTVSDTKPDPIVIPEVVSKPDPFASFDLNELEKVVIKDSNFLQKASAIKKLVTDINSATFQVVCLQSGYSVSTTALKTKDQNIVTNTIGTDYERTNRLYNMIYGKIADTSLGKISYEDFLEITSLADMETILYGIYASTFPEPESYTLNCPSCQQKFEVKVPANKLTQVKDPDVYSRIADIHMELGNTPKTILEKSLLAETHRFKLRHSNIIVDVRLPSLAKQLNMMKIASGNSKLKESVTTFSILAFINSIFVPNMEEFEKSGNVSFIQLEEFGDMFNVISALYIEDIKALEKDLDKAYTKYEIKFAIPRTKCSYCSAEQDNVTVNIEETLFHNLLS